MSFSRSEHSPNQPSSRLNDLMEMIRHDAYPDEQRQGAILKLGEVLQHQAQEMDEAQGIYCLIEHMQKGNTIKTLTQCIHVLKQLRAVSAVRVLLDISAGGKIALYRNKDLPDFMNTDEIIRLRILALQTLGHLKDERAILPLIRILNSRDENYRVRLAAAEALGRLGDQNAVTSLLDILSDDRERSGYLKESAVKALGMLGDIRALEPLIEMIESQQELRNKFEFLKEQTIAAIAQIIGRNRQYGGQRRAEQILIGSLHDDASSIRQAAVEALAEIGNSNNIPLLKDAIFDKEDSVALAAVSAIFALGGESAIIDLLSLDNLPQFLRHELETYLP